MTETESNDNLTSEDIAAAAALLRGESVASESTTPENDVAAVEAEPEVETTAEETVVEETTTPVAEVEAEAEVDLDALIEEGLLELEKAMPPALASAMKKKGKKLATKKDGKDDDKDDDDDKASEAKKSISEVVSSLLAESEGRIRASLTEQTAAITTLVEERLQQSSKALGSDASTLDGIKDALVAMQREITDIGNAAAPRRGATTVASKALGIDTSRIDKDAVLAWGRTVMDVPAVLQLSRDLDAGRFDGIPPEVLKGALR